MNRGDWNAAADWFTMALGFAPEDPKIRAHLAESKAKSADANAAAEIHAERRRIADSITAATIRASRRQLAGFAVPAAAQLQYPGLSRPVPPNSASGNVLAQYQPKVKEVDEEILRAQEALRHLIASNARSEEDRLEWTRESVEATADAEDLAISLALDLIGARVDELVRTANKEKADVLNRLLNRAEGDGQRNSIHSAYGMLLNRKDELRRMSQGVRAASKHHDLMVEAKKLSEASPVNNLWIMLTSLERTPDFTGPAGDLLDASYMILRQAMSFGQLVTIRANEEKQLQAAAALGRYIKRLEARKKTAEY